MKHRTTTEQQPSSPPFTSGPPPVTVASTSSPAASANPPVHVDDVTFVRMILGLAREVYRARHGRGASALKAAA